MGLFESETGKKSIHSKMFGHKNYIKISKREEKFQIISVDCPLFVFNCYGFIVNIINSIPS